ncbi:25485_t:CDS:2, partial [Racocetra persica]
LSQNSKLELLSISDNYFPPQDLSFLSHLVNLKTLGVGNGNKKRIEEGIYNHFFGSLKPLQNMTSLEMLSIDDTDLDDGLEYLPDSINFFWCSAKYKGDAKVKAIYNLFTGGLGERVTDEEFEFINNFSRMLQNYKRVLKERTQKVAEELNFINNLTSDRENKEKLSLESTDKMDSKLQRGYKDWKDIHPGKDADWILNHGNDKELRKEFQETYQTLEEFIRSEEEPEKKISVDAQEYFDKYYPKEQKQSIAELDIRNENLEGSLKIENFTNLRCLECSENKITQLVIINCPNLELVDCSYNRLVNLNFSNCPNLRQLSCYDNFLTELDLSQFPKLENLSISDNNFPQQDLSFLSSSNLVNLKVLALGKCINVIKDNSHRIENGIYNRFAGSLKPLQNMHNLEKLDISNTDIDSGLEYLPDTNFRKDAKVQDIYNIFSNEEGKQNQSLTLKNYLEILVPKSSEKKLGTEDEVHKLDNRLTSLVVKNCPNLTSISCGRNQLTTLATKNCPKIINISAEDNYLNNLDISHPQKLVYLNLSNNYYSTKQDLAFFNRFTNLEKILLGGIPFRGSLKSLNINNLTRLKEINISDTLIDDGLEYLPESLEIIHCWGCLRLARELKNYRLGSRMGYNYQA